MATLLALQVSAEQSVGWMTAMPSSPPIRPIQIGPQEAAKTLTDDCSALSWTQELGLTCLESGRRAASNEPSCFSRRFGPIVLRDKNVIYPAYCENNRYMQLPPYYRSVATVRLGKAKFDSFQSTLIKPKLCGPQGLYERGAHTKFQLPTCKWARDTLG